MICFEGTEPNTVCDTITGQCVCLLHARGVRCDRCADGFYNLGGDASTGCVSCGCDEAGMDDDVSIDATVSANVHPPTALPVTFFSLLYK